MSDKNRQQDLVTENQALNLYFDSLYDDAGVMEEDNTSPVVSPVSGDVKDRQDLPTEEREPESHSLSKKDKNQGVLNLLMITVSGVKMAVSADELDDVVDWTDQVLPIPDNMPLYLGLLEDGGRQIPVVDLARLVLPERILEQRRPPACQKILIIGSRRWGLGCDNALAELSVEQSAVNWRSERSTRKWLAGMISGHGRALIDTKALQILLREKTREAQDC